MGLFDFLKKKNNSEIFTDEELLDAGSCPNCWGQQQYEGKYVEFVKDKDKDNINKNAQGQKAFIAQFVETNIEGVHLQWEDGYANCKVCKNKYKHTKHV